ncbi:MAG: extracellular solute-binding protein [Clostridia bacterium]|nr:extracellular solute-binding protein [Clostridia bacterium]
MKRNIRIVIAMLILAMMLPTVLACAQTETPDTTTAPAATEAPSGDEATTVPEDTLFAPSEIPDDLRFDGTTVNFLYWDDVPNVEFFVEDQTGESVNDAIYKRNAKIQEQFGVTLDFVGTPGNYNKQGDFVNACVNSTQSGADAYDLFSGYTMTGATLMTLGVTQDLTDYDIMEFDTPWWPKSLISKATINGGIYFASGDISTNFIHMMYLTIFNKDMLMDIHHMGADELYDLAYDGKWTLDKLIELSDGVFLEQSGDNIAGEGDRFGVVVTSVHFDAFYAGSDLNTVVVNDDGNLELSPDLFSQKTVDLLEKLCNLLHVSGNAYIQKSEPLFAAGQALFLVDRPYIITRSLTDTDFSFGILPIPKYDEDQADYRTCLGFGYSMYMLSTAAPDPEAAAATLELMAYQSYLNVTPALFEESMKTRYADQSDDAFMFDKIRDGVDIDVARLFTIQLDKMSYSIFRNAVNGNTAGSYMSSQKAHVRALDMKIAAINETLKGLQ